MFLCVCVCEMFSVFKTEESTAPCSEKKSQLLTIMIVYLAEATFSSLHFHYFFLFASAWEILKLIHHK